MRVSSSFTLRFSKASLNRKCFLTLQGRSVGDLIFFFTFDQFSSNKNHFFIFIINPPEKAKHAVEFFSYLY